VSLQILKETVPLTEERYYLGVALAESFPIKAGKPAFLAQHLRRLAEGCRALAWPDPDLAAIKKACLQKAKGRTGSLRLRYWGEAPAALLIQRLSAGKLKGPLKLMTSVVRHYGAASLQSRLKASDMLSNRLAQLETQAWAEDGLRLTQDGLVAEGVWTNIVVRKGKVVRTPPLHLGLLEGVTRGRLLQRLGRKYLVKEESLTRYDLWTADEVWVCSSLRGALKVSHVDGRRLDAALKGERP
jgi:branched-subunit amino acid aminotransferase/4-amino-4-deoxychorismate lyase